MQIKRSSDVIMAARGKGGIPSSEDTDMWSVMTKQKRGREEEGKTGHRREKDIRNSSCSWCNIASFWFP
jgi:hypothetical protein